MDTLWLIGALSLMYFSPSVLSLHRHYSPEELEELFLLSEDSDSTITRNSIINPKKCSGQVFKPEVPIIGMHCIPRLAVVKIKGKVRQYSDLYIKLHRCIGGCHVGSGVDNYCTATADHPVCVEAHPLDGSVQKIYLEARNHTRCACGCAERRCAAAKEFDNQICDCVCKNNRNSCKPIHNFNKDDCTCKCRKPRTPCGTGMRWSTQTCACKTDGSIAA